MGRKIVALLLLVLVVAVFAVAHVATAAAGTIQGRVIDKQGYPLAGIVVEAYTPDGVLRAKTTTDDKGVFELRLESGTYEVVIYGRGYEEKRLKVEVKEYRFISLGDIVLDYALKVSLEAEKLEVKQGDTVELRVDVTNRGRFEESVNVNLVYPGGWDVKLLLPNGVEVRGFTLYPGESANFVLRMLVGRDANGTYAVKLVFAGSSTFAKTIVVVAEPKDWGILDVPYTRVTGFKGEELVVELTVRNTVGEDADFDLHVSGPEGWDLRLETLDGHAVSSIRLKEGAEAKLILRAYVPEDAEEKTYTIVIEASALGARSKVELKVDVKAGADKLKVESPSPFVEVRAGEKAVIPIKVSNRGTSATSVSFEVQGLPEGFSYSLKEQGGSLVSRIYLAPGKGMDLYLEIDVPYGLEPQLVEFTLIVKGEKSSDKIRLGLNVLGEYKLKVVTENFYVTMSVGSRTKFGVKVKNDGNSPLRNVMLEVYDVPSGIRVEVEPKVVPSLPPGEEVTFVLTIDADPKLAAGFYHVAMRITATGVRVERVLRIDVRPRGEYIYVGLLILFIVLIAAFYAWRKYGRR